MLIDRIFVTPEIGEHISKAIEEAIILSKNFGGYTVEFIFNGILMRISMLDTLQSALQSFYEAVGRVSDEMNLKVKDIYEINEPLYN